MDSVLRNKRMNIMYNIAKKQYTKYINDFGKDLDKFIESDYNEKILDEISKFIEIESEFIQCCIDDYEIDNMMYRHESIINDYVLNSLNYSVKLYDDDVKQKISDKETQKKYIEMSKSRKAHNLKKNTKKYDDYYNDNNYDNYSDS